MSLLLMSSPAPALDLVFSVDLGSDNAHDPGEGGERGFDPGDMYSREIDVPDEGLDGDAWDDAVLSGTTLPGPDPHDIRWPDLLVGPTLYEQFFDLDAAQLVDPALLEVLDSLDGTALESPLLLADYPEQEQQLLRRSLPSIAGTSCTLWLSYDDDVPEPYSWRGPLGSRLGAGTASRSLSPEGLVHGRTALRDEVFVVRGTLAGDRVVGFEILPGLAERAVNGGLRPNPSPGGHADDDVDALSRSYAASVPAAFFSADHEASGGLNSGSIYSHDPISGSVDVRVTYRQLGLSRQADLDAFEFVTIANGDLGEAVALLFSVDDDDPLTPGLNESGGKDPGTVYVSYLTGESRPFLDPAPTTLYGIQSAGAGFDEVGTPEFDDGPRLYRFDAPDFEQSIVGVLRYPDGEPIPDAESCASNSNGELFMIVDGEICEVSPSDPATVTAVSTIVSSADISYAVAMAFDDEDVLWLVDQGAEELYRVDDVSVGSATHVGTLPTLVMGLAFRPGGRRGALVGLAVPPAVGDLLHIKISRDGSRILRTETLESIDIDPSYITGVAVTRHREIVTSHGALWSQTYRLHARETEQREIATLTDGTRHVHGLTAVKDPVGDIDAIAVP